MGIPNNRFVIMERRQKVYSILSQGLNEIEIAKLLNVNQSTICRDIKAIKSDIRKKIRIFNEFELPLLQRCGFISTTTNCNAVMTNCNINHSPIVKNNEICAQNRSLGRDLDPGPLPYQGNALPG